MKLKHWLLASLALLFTSSLSAQEAVTTAPAQETQPAQATQTTALNESAEAIQQLVKDYVSAFNTGNVEELASIWAEDGVFVDQATGDEVKGRKALVESFRETFEQYPGLKLQCSTRSLSSASATVIVEEGEAIVTRADGTVSRSLYQVEYVKRENGWRIVRVIDNVSPSQPEVDGQAAADPLSQLDWLLGEWQDEAGESTIRISCQRTRGGKFLSRKYRVTIGEEVQSTGLQLISWDAAEQQIRSWLFDQEGTVVQATWTKDGDQWRIESVGTFGDGGQGSSTSLLTPLDEGSYRVEKVKRVIDGQILPNLEPAIVVRQP